MSARNKQRHIYLFISHEPQIMFLHAIKSFFEESVSTDGIKGAANAMYFYRTGGTGLADLASAGPIFLVYLIIIQFY